MEPHFLRALLDPLASTCRTGMLESDPVGLVHEFHEPRDVEVAGLFASSLALGRVTSIREKIRDLLSRLDRCPAGVCRGERPSQLARRFRGFRHRFFGGDDLAVLAANAGSLMREWGSLEAAWQFPAAPEPASAALAPIAASPPSFEAAADRFARALSMPVRGLSPASRLPLVVSPAGGSTCKRLALYVRWMVRPADGVDLGIWSCLTPADLVIPLDVHLFRISRLLGLTRRRTANWAAARSVTSALAALDPTDPVKYDFALSRIGIVHGCRGRWHAMTCPACPVRTACSAPRRRRATSGEASPLRRRKRTL